MPTYTDDFTRTDATSLGTASGGWAWNEPGDTFRIASNKGKALNGLTPEAYLDITDTPDVTISSVWVAGTAGTLNMLVARMTAATTYYSFWKFYDSLLRVRKTVAGVTTTLGDNEYTAWGTALFTAKGTSLRCFVDGTQKYSVTDGDITLPGKAGIYAGYVNGTTQECTVDDVSINARDLKPRRWTSGFR